MKFTCNMFIVYKKDMNRRTHQYNMLYLITFIRVVRKRANSKKRESCRFSEKRVQLVNVSEKFPETSRTKESFSDLMCADGIIRVCTYLQTARAAVILKTG